MSRRVRMYEQGIPYVITARCFQSRFLMKPTPRITETIGGILAQATHKYDDIKLHDGIFLSNHLHLTLSTDSPHLIPRFVGWILREISVRVGKEVDWSGSFFGRRYDSAPILDDQALIARISYMRAHGIKEGLVAEGQQWPGLSLVPELHHNSKRRFPFFYKTQNKTLNLPILTAPYPGYENMSAQQYRDFLQSIAIASEKNAVNERQGVDCLGAQKILAIHPHSSPKVSKSSPRIACFASSPSLIDDYQEKYRQFVINLRESYGDLLEAWRDIGDGNYFLPGFQVPV